MADTKFRYTVPNNSTSILPPYDLHSTPHQPYGLLSNSSFNHLNMFTKTSSLSSSPRSRQPTGSSCASVLTSWSIREAKTVRISALPRQCGRHYLLPPTQHNKSSDSLSSKGKRERSRERCRPRIAERQEGSSLPNVGVESVDQAQPVLEQSRIIPGLESDKMILGSSRQRRKRVEHSQSSARDIAIAQAREAHIAATMSTLTRSPETVQSALIATPPSPKSTKLPADLQAFRAQIQDKHDNRLGLGFGYIGQASLQQPHVTSGPVTSTGSSDVGLVPWRFTLPDSAPSVKLPSRSGSSNLGTEVSARLQSRFSDWSTQGSPARLDSAGGSSCLVSSYYQGSIPDRGRGGSSRGPSRLGQSQDMRSDEDISPFAFSPPPIPEIPAVYAAAADNAASIMPADSVSRPGSMVISPHRIRRKPVPELSPAELAQTKEPSQKCQFDLPKAQTVPRPQRPNKVYLGDLASRSTPAFGQAPLNDSNNSVTAPADTKSGGGMQAALDHLRALSAKKTRSFGRRREANYSYTSLDTADTTAIVTPRESCEEFSVVPVHHVSRDVGFAVVPQLAGPTTGYTTRRQREEAARMADQVSAEQKKGKGRFARMFSIKD